MIFFCFFRARFFFSHFGLVALGGVEGRGADPPTLPQPTNFVQHRSCNITHPLQPAVHNIVPRIPEHLAHGP